MYDVTSQELYHHGILGQRWGSRNGPPYPLKPGDHSASEKKAGWRKSLDEVRNDSSVRKHASEYKANARRAGQKYGQYQKESMAGLSPTKQSNATRKEYQQARKSAKRSREDLDDAVVKNRLANEKSKSKKRLQYEAEYKKKGLNDEDAAMQAYKRERMDKILKVSAGVAVAGIAAYSVYKYRDYAVDKVLNKDVLLNRIALKGDTAVGDSFFAGLKKNKMDSNKYLGLYNKQLKQQGVPDQQFEKIIKIGKETKIASPKNAKNVLAEMAKNDYIFQMHVEDQIDDIAVQMMMTHPIKMALVKHDLAHDKITQRVYDMFNVSMGAYGNKSSAVSKEYFDKLKSLGYGGIADMNDWKYSGFYSKFPVIIFDTSAASVEKMRKIGMAEENVRNALAVADIGVKSGAKILAAYGGYKGYKSLKNSKATSARNDRIVARYRKEHPNSKMSYRDIVRSYKDSHQK